MYKGTGEVELRNLSCQVGAFDFQLRLLPARTGTHGKGIVGLHRAFVPGSLESLSRISAR